MLNRLQKLIAELCEEQTIVFVVDELDRCLPKYAIKVLERLHHLTENSTNVITVLSMDKLQLQARIKQLFGFNEPEKYLEKFIQFDIKLDCGEVSEQVTEKFADYIAMFNKDLFELDDSIEEFIRAIFKDIDARTQEQIVKRAMVAHQMLYADKKDYVFMCMELLLTVLICVYDDESCFTGTPIKFGVSYETLFSMIFNTSKKEPAFSKFFEEKYRNINFSTRVPLFDEGDKYIIPHDSKLYCAVLLIWYWLHEENPRTKIAHYTGDVYTSVFEHRKSLKEFAETIKLLK